MYKKPTKTAKTTQQRSHIKLVTVLYISSWILITWCVDVHEQWVPFSFTHFSTFISFSSKVPTDISQKQHSKGNTFGTKSYTVSYSQLSENRPPFFPPHRTSHWEHAMYKQRWSLSQHSCSVLSPMSYWFLR